MLSEARGFDLYDKAECHRQNIPSKTPKYGWTILSLSQSFKILCSTHKGFTLASFHLILEANRFTCPGQARAQSPESRRPAQVFKLCIQITTLNTGKIPRGQNHHLMGKKPDFGITDSLDLPLSSSTGYLISLSLSFLISPQGIIKPHSFVLRINEIMQYWESSRLRV